MPFFLIPSTLGVCFFLIWAFIGGMVFRDSQLAAQREVDSDVAILPLPTRRAAVKPAHSAGVKRASRRRAHFAS